MNKTRRSFLKNCSQGIMALSWSIISGKFLACAPSNKPLNILWLDAEDLCPDLGCYGTADVKTPNIDRLAADGARYPNAFTTSPVCSPSRSAIITGMYQTTIGAHHHRSHRKDGYTLPKGIKLVTDYFKQAGYYVCRGEADKLQRPGKLDYNFKASFKDVFDGTDWRQRKPGQPFFAQIHFHETHRTFKADSENPIDPKKVTLPGYYPDHPLVRKDWALYLETAQILDKKVGKILNRLEADGLAENTVVIFTGDHGRPMLRGKQWLYEGGIHIPLIIRWPGRIKPSTVDERLVTSLDLAPTWLQIAGITPPTHLQGRSLLKPDTPKREYIFAARDRCDETSDRIRCVRSKQFKYIRNFQPERPYMQFNAYKMRQYPTWTLMQVLHKQGKLTPAQKQWMATSRPVEELYDLNKDPDELNNLADQPEFHELLLKFRKVLNEWVKQTDDQGVTPEDPKIPEHWNKVARRKNQQQMQRRGLPPNATPEEYLAWWEKQYQL